MALLEGGGTFTGSSLVGESEASFDSGLSKILKSNCQCSVQMIPQTWGDHMWVWDHVPCSQEKSGKWQRLWQTRIFAGAERVMPKLYDPLLQGAEWTGKEGLGSHRGSLRTALSSHISRVAWWWPEPVFVNVLHSFPWGTHNVYVIFVFVWFTLAKQVRRLQQYFWCRGSKSTHAAWKIHSGHWQVSKDAKNEEGKKWIFLDDRQSLRNRPSPPLIICEIVEGTGRAQLGSRI